MHNPSFLSQGIQFDEYFMQWLLVIEKQNTTLILIFVNIGKCVISFIFAENGTPIIFRNW